MLEFCETDNVELVEKVLLACGSKVADRYILLNQELWDGCSCYYNVGSVLEKLFKVDNVFGNVFCTWPKNIADCKELIAAKEMYEIMEELGLDEEEE